MAASRSSREVWEAVLEGCSVVVLRAGRGEIAKAKHSGRLCQASLHAFTPRLLCQTAAASDTWRPSAWNATGVTEELSFDFI